MVNEEEKFDDLLRQKLSEKDFFFDELNWQKENDLIERYENRKKRRRFVIIFFSGIGMGIALTIPFMNILNNTRHNKTISQQGIKGSTTVINPKTVAVNDKAGENKYIQPANKNTALVTPGKALHKNNNVAIHASPVKHTRNITVVTKGNKNKKTGAGNSVALNNNKPVQIPAKGIIHRQAHNKKPGNMMVSAMVSANDAIRQSAVKSKSTDKNRNNKEIAVSLNTVNQNNNVSATDAGNSANKKVNSNSATVTVKENKATTTAKATPESASDSNTNKNQITPTGASATAAIKPPAKSIAFNTIDIDAGGGYCFGWKNYWLNNEGSGLSPVFGISATHFFNKKIAVSIGVQYNSIINLKTGYQNTDISYDFGYNENFTSVVPHIVHYMAVPLYFRYNFNKDNALCAGGSFLYLVNTSSSVTKATESSLNTGANTSKTESGYTKGFNTMDIQLNVAYRRRIYKTFSVALQGYYGLMDVENSFFSDSRFKRNTGMRLILSYTLIK